MLKMEPPYYSKSMGEAVPLDCVLQYSDSTLLSAAGRLAMVSWLSFAFSLTSSFSLHKNSKHPNARHEYPQCACPPLKECSHQKVIVGWGTLCPRTHFQEGLQAVPS